MKKFLKVFIIVLLVLGVIGGTAFFFFRKIEKENNTTTSIVAMLKAEKKLEFNEDLKEIQTYVNSDGTDTRVDLIISTSEKLDEIVYILSTYHIENNTKINNEQIADQFKEVKNSRSLLSRMIAEYKIKKDSSKFDRHLGANDLYEQSCDYLVNCAKLANLINNNLDVDKSADIKFNMFEVYANVVIDTFNDKNINKGADIKTDLKNADNIDVMNSVLQIRNSYIVKIENANTQDEIVTHLFTANNNYFNNYYNKCDKSSFAKNLANNLELVTDSEQPTNEKIATYYFRLIYGI